jgi:hypothetical protein
MKKLSLILALALVLASNSFAEKGNNRPESILGKCFIGEENKLDRPECKEFKELLNKAGAKSSERKESIISKCLIGKENKLDRPECKEIKELLNKDRNKARAKSSKCK